MNDRKRSRPASPEGDVDDVGASHPSTGNMSRSSKTEEFQSSLEQLSQTKLRSSPDVINRHVLWKSATQIQWPVTLANGTFVANDPFHLLIHN